ncbi:TPA: hypothetical protein PXN25_002669 [Yersinia enterocolitica]|nr:hypothetical protein [Yersinia enterocolitica]
MSELLNTPSARDWVKKAIQRHANGIYGKIVPAVIWTDARGNDGELLVNEDPINLVAKINMDPFILLHNHDPGKPKGYVLESECFESKDGTKFVAAVLGLYSGKSVVEFSSLDFVQKVFVSSPKMLPLLPDGEQIEFATDPREVDAAWLAQVINDAPLPIEYTELSHNAADAELELIRIGIGYLAIVWNPYVTSVASEAGKRTYTAIHEWLRKLLSKLADRRNPLLDVSSYQNDCQVSFLFRGKDVKLHYAAHEALPKAAAQAAQLISNFKDRGKPARLLTYEWDKDAHKWYPSYAVLNDQTIIVDSSTLIAVEQLPTELSLGIRKGESLIPVIKSALEPEDK